MGNHSCRPGGSAGGRSSRNKRWQPSELYDSCLWDEKTVRRMISRGRLAHSLPGKETRETGNEHDCPICLHHYDEANKLSCCKATICTECYLQVQDPVDQSTPCPFCKCAKMRIVPTKQLNRYEAFKREKDEQKVIEAKFKARKNSESMTIQLPQDLSAERFADRQSDAQPKHTDCSSSSTPNNYDFEGRSYDYDIDFFDRILPYPDGRPRSHDLPELLLYQTSNSDQLYGLEDDSGSPITLSEENQLALAIQLSLRNT